MVKRRGKISPEIRAEVVRLSERGIKQVPISKLVGISNGSVNAIIQERKRILAEAAKGNIVKADVSKEGPVSTVKISKEEIQGKKVARLRRVSNITDKVNSPDPVSVANTLTINYNGLNIHLNKDNVTDVFLSEGKVKIVSNK